MKKFKKLFLNESNKLLKSKRNIYFFIALITVNIILGVMSLNFDINLKEDWKEHVQNEIKIIEEQLQERDKLPEGVLEVQINTLNRLNYHLEQEINPYINNNLTFLKKSVTFFNIIIVFYLIFLSCESISNEFNHNTIKNLLTTPNKRWKILISKYISLLYFFVISYLVVIITSLIIGSFINGFGGIYDKILVYYGTSLEVQYLVVNILLILLVNIIKGIVYITLGFALSIMLSSYSVSLLLSLSIWFGSSFIANWLGQFPISKYLIFTNLNIEKYIPNLDTNVASFSSSIVILLAYIVLFLIVSIWIFNRKDIA